MAKEENREELIELLTKQRDSKQKKALIKQCTAHGNKPSNV